MAATSDQRGATMATKLNNRFVHFRGPQDGRFLLWHGDHERAAALQRDRQRNRLDSPHGRPQLPSRPSDQRYLR